MSAFSKTQEYRIVRLKEVARLLLEAGNVHAFIVNNQDFIASVVPEDFIHLFDSLVAEHPELEKVKDMANKMLNIFHIPIRDYKRLVPKPDSFLGIMEQNNRAMEQMLDQIRPVFKAFMADPKQATHRKQLLNLFIQLESFTAYYTIKENVLFPFLEKHWTNYRCLHLMWSYHDDIRRNIKAVLELLSSESHDRKDLAPYVGDIFFDMLAIKFREEHILYPHILATLQPQLLDDMKWMALEIGYPFCKPEASNENIPTNTAANSLTQLGTGALTPEQIRLVFNHLPVDITFVDASNKVAFFSSPKRRVFPRTKAIIGRDVSNCHPKESVHVVEKIVESFRTGAKDHADFWIHLKDETVLIQYFAVRDEQGIYQGVLEVTQEVSAIRALQGEKRLLDW
jgi:DUF438 domain-containing protein